MNYIVLNPDGGIAWVTASLEYAAKMASYWSWTIGRPFSVAVDVL